MSTSLADQTLATIVKEIFKSKVNLASLCRDMRINLSLSQKEMANNFNVPLQTYEDWEAGNTEPNGQVVSKLFLLSNFIYLD